MACFMHVSISLFSSSFPSVPLMLMMCFSRVGWEESEFSLPPFFPCNMRGARVAVLQLNRNPGWAKSETRTWIIFHHFIFHHSHFDISVFPSVPLISIPSASDCIIINDPMMIEQFERQSVKDFDYFLMIVMQWVWLMVTRANVARIIQLSNCIFAKVQCNLNSLCNQYMRFDWHQL